VIEGSEIQCDFAIPDPGDRVINYDNIQVEFLPGTGDPVAIGRVGAVGDCDADDQYYFDDNGSPTTIHLCADTCTMVQADDEAELGIDLGCLGI
jgi:hypothetical protein